MSNYLSPEKTAKNLNEFWLHNLWKNSKLSKIKMQTTAGQNLQIIFSGWYNKGWGPDFKDSRIMINDDEKFGDIEIHIEESSWRKHGHHLDEAYNKVILHVYLLADSQRSINKLGQSVNSLDLASRQFECLWETLKDNPKSVLKESPGLCGLSLYDNNFQKLKKVIFQAAEKRLVEKSLIFEEQLKNENLNNYENYLFASLLKSLGYSAYALRFEELGHFYPYKSIKKYLKLLYRQARVEILARWFGSLEILAKTKDDHLNEEVQREWKAFKQCWQELKTKKIVHENKTSQASRPLNNPVRRLVGLFYHLEATGFEGLIKSWLKFLLDCQELIEEKDYKRKIMKLLDEMFPQPDWEPLNLLLHQKSQKQSSSSIRFIGKNRQLIIMTNSILPFFLFWAKKHNEKKLEKTLFKLFLLLPSEGKNSKTTFMEQRLLADNVNFSITKNLSYHQGMIQLNEDCCRSFYEGCRNCHLLEMISK